MKNKIVFTPIKIQNAITGAALIHGMGCEHKPPFVINVHHWCVHMDIPHQKEKWWK